MSFDYNSPDVDADTVAAVVADISGNKTPPPVSDEQRAEYESFMAAARRRAEQQQLERDQRRAEAAEAERLVAEHAAAISRAEAQKRHADEYQQRVARQTRDRSLTEILNSQIEQRNFRQTAIRSAQHAASRQRLKSVLYPPEPPPLPQTSEPQLDDEDAARWHRTWFK